MHAVLKFSVYPLCVLCLSGCGGGGSSPAATPAPLPAATPMVQGISASADASLFEAAQGDVASGKGGALFAGRTLRDGLRRLLIRFDSAALPTSAPEEARLILHSTKVRDAQTSKRFTVHRVLESWSEGGSDAGEVAAGKGAAAQAGDATWLHRSFDSLFWGSAGGVYAATASAQAMLSGNEEVSFMSINQGLEQDIAAWISDPQSNFGWIVLGEEDNAGDAVAFASREHSQVELRPQLILE